MSTYEGVILHFMRISNYVAWSCTINGEVYGDWITLREGDVDAGVVQEAFELLNDQAQKTIKELHEQATKKG